MEENLGDDSVEDFRNECPECGSRSYSPCPDTFPSFGMCRECGCVY